MGRVRVETDGPVKTVILNRPEKRNAMDAEMLDALYDATSSTADSQPMLLWICDGAWLLFVFLGIYSAWNHESGWARPVVRFGRVIYLITFAVYIEQWIGAPRWCAEQLACNTMDEATCVDPKSFFCNGALDPVPGLLSVLRHSRPATFVND